MNLSEKFIRKVPLLLGSLLLANPVFAESTFPEDIYVTLKKSGELAQLPKIGKWKGSPVMLYNSLTPDGKRMIVSSPKTGYVYIYDTNSHAELAKVKVQKAPKGVKISPDGNEAYVANEASASISVVDLSNYREVAVIPVKKLPHNVRFSNDGSLAYITLQGGAGIGVINTQTRRLTKVIATPGIPNPHNLDISKDGTKVFIRDLTKSVGVLDLLTEKIIKVLPVGKGHAGIDVSPDGKTVYTGAIGDNVLTAIDTKTLTVSATINVGNGPHGVRASKDNKWIYVATTKANQLVVIDAKKMAVSQRYPLADFPFWVSVKGNP